MWEDLLGLLPYAAFFVTVAIVCWLVEREARHKKRDETKFRRELLDELRKKKRE